MHFAHAAAVDAEILCKAIHSAPFNGAVPRYYAVPQRLVKEHVVVVRSVGHERVNLEEGPLVKKQADAVPCGATPGGANGFLALESTPETSGFSLRSQFFERMVGCAVHGFSTPFRFLIQTLTLSGFGGVHRRGSFRARP